MRHFTRNPVCGTKIALIARDDDDVHIAIAVGTAANESLAPWIHFTQATESRSPPGQRHQGVHKVPGRRV